MRLVTDAEATLPASRSALQDKERVSAEKGADRERASATAEEAVVHGSRADPSPKFDARSVTSLGAAVFALAAFVVALVAGAAAGRDATSVLARALAAMALCWPIGWIALRIAVSTLGAQRVHDMERAGDS